MTTLRHIHRYMNDRRRVVLDDGRAGKIVRVDTVFPENETYVTVITDAASDSSVKVLLSQVKGPAES
ncbi:MAG TPA: hypothetical protein VFQ61_08820 [Polyangiaceae bacterium]|nr:hypothetical protein [Polyangiaceae bacterium]